MEEIWKYIDGYKDYNGFYRYKISNFGMVNSYWSSFKCWEPLRIYKSKNTYSRVRLYENKSKKWKEKLIHRLLYETFIGKIPENCVVHHIDKNKQNNNLDNLKLMNKSEHRQLHMKGENNPMFGKDRSGENNPRSILTEHQAKIIYQISNSPITKQLKITQKEIGEVFGVSRITISAIKYGKIWKHIK